MLGNGVFPRMLTSGVDAAGLSVLKKTAEHGPHRLSTAGHDDGVFPASHSR